MCHPLETIKESARFAQHNERSQMGVLDRRYQGCGGSCQVFDAVILPKEASKASTKSFICTLRPG